MAPEMDLSLLLKTVTVRVGEKLNMMVPYQANPEPTITWLVNGAEPGEHVQRSQSRSRSWSVRHNNLHYCRAVIHSVSSKNN